MPRPTPEERAAEAARLASISWAEAERQRIRATPYKSKRLTRAQAKLAGLCVVCKWRDATGRWLTCDYCRARNRKRAAHYKEQYLAAGLCIKCGKLPFVPGYQKCEGCMEKHRVSMSGGKPRKLRILPLGVLPPDDLDAGIMAARRHEARAVADAHRAAVNALVGLANERKNDTNLRWRVRALVASGELLMEAL